MRIVTLCANLFNTYMKNSTFCARFLQVYTKCLVSEKHKSKNDCI